MSAKKSPSVVVSWVNCPTCRNRFPQRSLLQKHAELSCGRVLPFVQSDGSAVIEISCLQDSSLEGLLRNPEGIVFINVHFLREMELKSLDWVVLQSGKDKEIEEEDTHIPIAMRVWPIEGSPLKAFVHSKAQATVRELSSKGAFTIQQMDAFVPIAREVAFRIQTPSSLIRVEELQRKLEQWFSGKRIRTGSSFLLPFFTYRLLTIVISVDGSRKEEFHCITKETNIILQGPQIQDQEKSKEKEWRVGGLVEETNELTVAIRYAIASPIRKGQRGRGILVHGQQGTGKTLLVESLAQRLDLHQIRFRQFEKKSIREVFLEARQTKGDCAVILDNLDVLCSSRGEDLGFTHAIRSEMDELPPSARVVILATATNPQHISPILRSPHVFAKELEIPVPSVLGRRHILETLLNGECHSLCEQEVQRLAEATHGFVGGDLVGLCRSASLLATEETTMGHFAQALKHATPSAIKSIQLEIPNVRWKDIGGMEELKFQLKQSVEWPLRHPEAFLRLGLTPPKGVLMYGPPGCSKTMIAKALATESGLNFLSVKGSDLFSKWVGESEKSVQELFRKARQVAPAILFFDELDALGSERGQQGGASNVHERVLAQLLIEIDGVEPLNDVTIVAATNRPDLIDKALTRPGRLDRIIYVPLPDDLTRRQILMIRLEKMPISEDVDLDFLVGRTEGYSGAEICGICQEAGLKALETNLDAKTVCHGDFLAALTKSPRRITPQLISFYDTYALDKE